MRKTILTLVAAMMLGGCVTEQAVWDKPGVTATAFEQDKNQCVYESKLATPGSTFGAQSRGMNAVLMANIDDVARTKDLQAACMQARGYTKRNVMAEADPLQVVPEIKQAK